MSTMMETTPVATSQPLSALAKGNEVRLARAQLKRDIRDFKVDVCDVIADPPEYAANMTVEALISSLHRFGPTRVSRVVHGICRPNLRLGTAGHYTRRRLCDAVDEALGREPQLRASLMPAGANHSILP